MPAQRTGTRRWFTPVMGNEVTTPAGHFNIFPVAAGAAAVLAEGRPRARAVDLGGLLVGSAQRRALDAAA